MARNMAEGYDVLRGLRVLEWWGLQPASVVERGEWLVIRCASVGECVSVQVLFEQGL